MDLKNNLTNRKHIESHSSSLTNDRIKEIKDVVWKSGLEMLSNPIDGYRAINFFAAIMQYFEETHMVYQNTKEDIKTQIDQDIKEGWEMLQNFRTPGYTPTTDEINKLNSISLRLQYIMNQGLQNVNYFFRFGIKEEKGIDAAMEIFSTDKWKKNEEKE